MNLIYCFDKLTKDKLISKGYNLIKEEFMQNQKAWVFAYQPEIKFDITDKTKYLISNTMRF